jgi:hypothetical protein
VAQINDISGSYGAAGKIFLDIETVFEHLARLMKDLGELPNPDDVGRFSGASHGVAAQYHAALKQATESASFATTQMHRELVDADAAIRKAVEALTAQDADADASAGLLLDALDNSVQQSEAPAVANTTTTLGTTEAPAESAR